jgi:hypothetical protein
MHQSWPIPERLAASSKNGGDYLAQRRSLLRTYAAAWLLALHDLDAVFYGKTCFELVLEIAAGRLDAEANEEMASNVRPLTILILRLSKVDLTLRHITRLCQAFVVFTTFDDIFLLWLECSLNRPLNKVSQSIPYVVPY